MSAIVLWAAASTLHDVVPRSYNMGWGYLNYIGDTKAETGSTFFKLIVALDGKPEQCIVLLSTHNEALNKAVCVHAMKFRFKPALNDQGQPTYAVVETMVNFAADGGATVYLQEPDFIVNLEAIPEGLPARSYVVVTVQADEQGRLVACDPGPPVKNRGKLNNTLTRMQELSCKQLTTLWDPLIETNLEKKRISYVRTVRVGFEKRSEAPSPKK